MSEDAIKTVQCTFDYAQYLPVRVYAKDGVKLPEYKTSGAGCMDVRSNADVVIPSKGWVVIPTGLFIEVPEGWCMRVISRSGLAASNCIFVVNGNGAVDSDYRGEFIVILANMSDFDIPIEKGDRIAQVDFHKVTKVHWELVPERSMLSDTDRSSNGLGHTGLK